jgi:transcriptional regulator of acetoin/glycerol metabolism
LTAARHQAWKYISELCSHLDELPHDLAAVLSKYCLGDTPPPMPRKRRGRPYRQDTYSRYMHALQATGGVVTATARLLGVNRTTVYRTLHRYPSLQRFARKP